MIYGNNNSVKLYGEVADNFLESVGVGIFDDGDIAIGESIFDLSTGCDILEENGIVLCEDCIVLEGKQAEEYKARKAKEKADAEKVKGDELKFDSENNKYMYGTKIGKNYPRRKVSRDDARGDLLRMNTARNIENKAYRDYQDKYDKDHNPNHLRRSVDVDTIATHRSIMRNLKNQDRIAKSKKSTVQHNSTIFSDIEII